MRPRRIDTFPFAGTPTELLLLECRLTELYDVMDHFVIVEATVNHQDVSKPLNYLENECRYKQWADKITYVVADDMPSIPEGETHQSDPWAREHAQREWIAAGLELLDVDDDDIVFQSDLDEIPKPLAVRNVRPRGEGAVSFRQRGLFFAIDWEYPPGWSGTVAMRAGGIPSLAREGCGPFTAMRDKRNSCVTQIPNAGWHLSWLGGPDEARTKIDQFCHPEVLQDIEAGKKPTLEQSYEFGIHIDGTPMVPVEVDHTFPTWLQDPENVPDSWRRPR